MSPAEIPASASNDCGFEITVLKSDDNILSKTIKLGDGGIVSDGSSCWMSSGSARRQRISGTGHLIDVLSRLGPNDAIALGRLAGALPAEVQIRSKAKMPSIAASNLITRSADNLVFEAGRPAFALLDIDLKGVTSEGEMMADLLGGYHQLLCFIFPFLKDAGCVVRLSTSSCITNVVTGESFSGSGGLHIYMSVLDGVDIKRAIGVMHDRLWLAGYGWYLVGKAGQLLERSLIDRSVAAPERLVFEAPPTLIHPLVQDVVARLPKVAGSGVLDTRLHFPDLNPQELIELEKLKRQARQELEPVAAKVRERSDQRVAKQMSDATGTAFETCLRLVAYRHKGQLTAAIPLVFDDPEIGTITVGDVLSDIPRYAGETLADPLEGVSYGRCKAMVMVDEHGWPFIHSFAHGRQFHDLKYDAGSLETVLEVASAEGLVDRFIALLKHSVLAEDERAKAIALVAARASVPVPSVKTRVKAEYDRLAALRKSKQAAQTADSQRVMLDAPALDAELTPVLRDLDRVLASEGSDPRPMRNGMGQLVCIHDTPLDGLHELTGDGSEQQVLLPAPPEPRIVPLDTPAATMLIERHVEYQRQANDEGVRLVRLQQPFVDAYRTWTNGLLPTVHAVATAPIVTQAGKLLTTNGLDPQSGVFYRISPEMLDVAPGGVVTDQDAVNAWLYLTDEWLCDVATDITGKSIAIAYALTLIERVLLPARPAFFFTAAQRAAGKTTLANMLVAAVTGQSASAAAWTESREERRKALMATMRAGAATIVWDNIPRGSLISCPHIEALLTASTYTDRILGLTQTETVSAQTVFAFTGNNIGPKGDLSSRSLVCLLNVQRPDPENRTFRHDDPVQWTRHHRAKILRALYTLLLWRSSDAEDKKAPTRFKAWWSLVGRPLEGVAKLTGHALCFGSLFAAVESDDEVADGTARCYGILRSAFGFETFTASQVAGLINGAGFTDLTMKSDDQAEQGSAEALKSAIADAAGSPFGPGAPGAQQVAKKLQCFVDRPAALDDKVVQLRRQVDRQLGNRYHLKEMARHA